MKPIVLLVAMVVLSAGVSAVDDCRSDCSRAEDEQGFLVYRCDAGCDGLAGCEFPEVWSPETGLSLMQACDQKLRGWPATYNATHRMTCCDNATLIEMVPLVGLSISYADTVTDVESFYLGSFLYTETGTFYSVYLVEASVRE
jgi:hypothetical protein